MALRGYFYFITLCLWVGLAHAAGFDLIEVPADKAGPALHGAVWTPCDAVTGKVVLGSVVFDGNRNCPVAGVQLPLIVISHGYGGSFFDQRDTAEVLANAGFVIASVDHSDDNYRIRRGPDDTILALATRTTDIKRLIDYMLVQWPDHARIAVNDVGFYGFSRGGYTGLVLAGANPDFRLLPLPPPAPCTSAPDSPMCEQLPRHFNNLFAQPLTHDSRIKVAVIADPLAQVFTHKGLENVAIPIQLWASASGGDGVTPETVAALQRNLSAATLMHAVANSTHFGFLLPCSPALTKSKPDICRDPPGFDRVAFHADFNVQVLAFFKRHLGLPPIH